MWGVIGHGECISGLEREIQSGQIPQALLLTGPSGVGKTAVGLALAQRLNCVENEPPCGQCVHCRQIAGGNHPDVTVIERPEGKDSIPISAIRDVRDEASLRPFQGRSKVVIIAGAEALTLPAADALLKTLEEPQATLTIVLTAGEMDAVPATIVSRCRHVSLHPVATGTIEAALESRGVENSARIARLARGSVGWAIRAAAAPRMLAQQEDTLRQLAGLLDLTLADRLQLVEALVAERKDRGAVRRALETLALIARDLLMLGQGLTPVLLDGDNWQNVRTQSRRYTLAQILAYLSAIRTAMERIDANVDARLTLEALVMALP